MKNCSEIGRFWSHVDKTGECWIWTAARNERGYGLFRKSFEPGKGYRLVKAHRYSWELANGPIPNGLEPDHLCHVNACVRPDHMRLATHRANNQNYRGNERCHKGHPFTPKNTGMHYGRRYCRTCENAAHREWRAGSSG